MRWALEVDDLRVWYGDAPGLLATSLRIAPGQVFGLIGETGSGKTSTALAIARLLPPGARIQGRVVIDALEVTALNKEDFRAFRGAKVGFIPQDAMASLNPLMSVGRQIAEVFTVHQGTSPTRARRKAVESLRRVWIHDAPSVAKLYPHQLSGGMRQRVMIAMALALEPPLLIADEPTTALDVSTQAEIIKLVSDLCRDLGTAVLWITHDMGIVAELADRVGVMYAGRMVEEGTSTEIFDDPHHPYTAELLRTMQSLRSGASGERLHQISGQPPRTLDSLMGCPFYPRCSRGAAECGRETPSLIEVRKRRVACYHPISPEEPISGGHD